jgi:ABC-type multidrug transport system fused ATPase/permease subunit
LQVLSEVDKNKMYLIIVIQVLMSFLDLAGVLAVGLLMAISIQGLNSNSSNGQSNWVLDALNVSGASLQHQMAILAAVVVLLLVGRTVFSIVSVRRILFFFSWRGAKLSSELVSRLLSQPLSQVQERTQQELAYTLTNGVTLITIQILATSVVLISDIALLVIMAIGLFIVDPVTSIISIVIFSCVGYFLYLYMNVRARELGRGSSILSIKSSEKIVEVFSTYRELVVGNRRAFYAGEIGKIRFKFAKVNAELNFLPYVSKYIIETVVVVGALVIGLIEFLLNDATQAISTIAIFLAAGSRVAPAVLRVQQGGISIRSAQGQADLSLNLIDSLRDIKPIGSVEEFIDLEHLGFDPSISISQGSFTYPGSDREAISGVTIDVPSGALVAFVGPSGAGKTTIIDVILGILNLDKGTVLVSGLSPLEAITKWPGAIAYVPQDTVIINGSIRENVGLGFPADLVSDNLVKNSLRLAKLDEFVESLPQGLDTQVGEHGTKISGGQRQRLGIARAMFRKPLLLVLDEATSSLDGETEASISSAIEKILGGTTVLMIAHRLSTVRNADYVVYMEEGQIRSVGSFDEVRSSVVEFDNQAKLMGL